MLKSRLFGFWSMRAGNLTGFASAATVHRVRWQNLGPSSRLEGRCGAELRSGVVCRVGEERGGVVRLGQGVVGLLSGGSAIVVLSDQLVVVLFLGRPAVLIVSGPQQAAEGSRLAA